MTLWQYLKTNSSHKVVGREHEDLLQRVESLAERDKRTPDEVIFSLINQALESQRSADHAHQNWEALSPREKQVAALVCAGLTGRQVAARLVISPETVKTHMRHILRKFGLCSRRELRAMLDGWDLSVWSGEGGCSR
ncbi:MAG: LuxR C-terminal-related transcriptional regulator [Pelolinea sp.]|nr:LuxR C-terminal-related transcriptional regulator [Pelolinea sp.]